MDPGRKLQTYTAYGIQRVRPIGGSWTGDPNHPVADTGKPVLVVDTPQDLMPHEAEQLHGPPMNCTAALGATNRNRLKAVCWPLMGCHCDLYVTCSFFSPIAHSDTS